jgi:hypothetical protein
MDEFKNRNIIKLGLTSVLIYSIFNKILVLTSILLIWLNLELQIENQFILYFLTILSGIISLWVLNFLYKYYLKKERIKRKSINKLVGIIVVLFFTISGLNILYPTLTIDIDIEEFKRHFLHSKFWFKNADILFQILALIIYLFKINNRTIRIAISSILIYLIYIKSYLILVKSFLWLNINLRIENEIILNVLNIIIGISVLTILIYIYNKFIKKDYFSKNRVYILILLNLTFSLAFFGLTEQFENFMINIDLGEFREVYLNQYGSSLGLNLIFPIIGLIYYLRKLKTDKSTVANNVHKK